MIRISKLTKFVYPFKIYNTLKIDFSPFCAILVTKVIFFQDIVLKVVLGTKKTKRRESSYTKIAKYAMENVRIVKIV